MDEEHPPGSPASGSESTPPSEQRAKDVLGQQPVRRTLGERLSRRVGGRRYDRAPIVSCTGKIFARYDLADPWEPDSEDRPLSLGPVGMRFEERRQPAPHAKVKTPKAKQDKPAWTPPKGIPDARGSKTSAPSAAAAKPRSIPAPRSAQPPPASEVASPAPLPPVAPPPRGTVLKKHSSGRFRMRPTSTHGPRVRQVQRVVEHEETAPPEPAPTTSPPPPPQSLDDLFGSLGAGGRDKRMDRKKKD